MNGYRGTDPRIIGLVNCLNQVDREEDFFRSVENGLFEKSVPVGGLPKGFRVDMYGNEPSHHEAHVRVRYKQGDGNYLLRNGKRRDGNIETKYEAPIINWILANKDSLLECWNELKDGQATGKPKTAWWGSDSWKDDINDDSSPSACRLLVLGTEFFDRVVCEDGPIDISKLSNYKPSRFIGLARANELCVGKLDGSTIRECQSVCLQGKYGGEPLVVEFAWLNENNLDCLVATLPGISFDDLVQMAGEA